MRIALVHHITYQFHGLSDLAFFLAKRGHEVAELSWSGSKRLVVDQVGEGLTRYLLPGLNFSLNNLIPEYPYLPTLPEVIETVGPDIIHAQSPLFLTTFSAIKGALKCNVPSVITVHGMLAKRELPINFAQKMYLHTVGSWCFKNATKTICLTRSDAHEATKYGCPLRKIRIIPNGVDIKVFRPSSSMEKDNSVGWMGRFVPEKGLKYLVDAIEIISGLKSSAEFLLIGDGPLKAKTIEMLNRCGLNKRTVFPGKVPHEKIYDLISRLSVFVLPSVKEGMPMALLEVMASGKPVVCSDIPGISDVVTHGQNGLLIPPRNSEALANAVLTLLDDETLRRRLGQNARRLMAEKYSWNIVISNMEKVYNEAIKAVR